MQRRLLLTPGPTQVPPFLCEALGRPIMHHRTPQFQACLAEVQRGLRNIMMTQNPVALLASSGTGAMEAAVASLLSPRDEVIVVEGGKFGERWREIAAAYGLTVHSIMIEWGDAVTPEQIQEALAHHPQAKAVFLTLCETSTGVDTDLAAIGPLIKSSSAVSVVDAVSGLGVTPLKTDEWGLDVVVSASHKGLMLPPGLAFVSASPRARTLMEKAALPRYYWNLHKYFSLVDKNDTPFTPAIGLITALKESLRVFEEKGLEVQWRHCARLAEAARAAGEALGLSLFAKEGCRSQVLTAFRSPAGVDSGKIVKTMRDEYGISIAGGQGPLKGKIFRIAHMGALDEFDLITGFACLEKVLHRLGHAFAWGTSVSAAQAVLNDKAAGSAP